MPGFPRLFTTIFLPKINMVMCEIDNKKAVEGVIGELRNYINKNEEKLLGYIMKNEKGTFPLPDETVVCKPIY